MADSTCLCRNCGRPVNWETDAYASMPMPNCFLCGKCNLGLGGSAVKTEEFQGIVENMPSPARVEREEALLQLIEGELRRSGGLGDLDDVLSAVAAQERIAVSQLKHGLNRGIAFGSLLIGGGRSFDEPLTLSLSQLPIAG